LTLTDVTEFYNARCDGLLQIPLAVPRSLLKRTERMSRRLFQSGMSTLVDDLDVGLGFVESEDETIYR
jgi:hypothetical protein